MKNILFIILTSFASISFAQEHSFLTPIGAYEGIAGNTGIARDGSVGAVIYNPAGIATVKTNKISASGSAYSSNSITLKGQDFDEKAEFIQTTPGQVTTSFNNNYFSWAFSVVVPKSQEYDYAGETGTENLDKFNKDGYNKIQETLIGPSIGFQLSKYFKLGASFFILKRDEKYRILEYEDASNFSSQDFLQNDISTISVLPIVGALITPTERFSIGFKFSPPSTLLSGDVKSKRRYVYWDTGAGGVCPPPGIPDGSCSLAWYGKDAEEKAKYQKPMEVGLGLSVDFTENLKVLADATHQFKNTVTIFEANDANEEGNEIKYRSTTRFNLGFEYLTSSTDALTLGFMYNPDPVDGDGNLNFMGGTIGYRSIDDIADSSFGLFYNQASSDSQGVKLNYTMYGLFLSTSINFMN
jgi:hypothetical protein